MPALGQGAPVEAVLGRHGHVVVIGHRAQNLGQDRRVPGRGLIGGHAEIEVVPGQEKPGNRRGRNQDMDQRQAQKHRQAEPAHAGTGMAGQNTHRAQHLAKTKKERSNQAGRGRPGQPSGLGSGKKDQGQAGQGRHQQLGPKKREKKQGAAANDQVPPTARTGNRAAPEPGGPQSCEPGRGRRQGAKWNEPEHGHIEVQRAADHEQQPGPVPLVHGKQVQPAAKRGQRLVFPDQGR